jgi:hypothetical protein
MLINLEKRYGELQENMLAIEDLAEYERSMKAAVIKALEVGSVRYTDKESAAIDKLEKVLRHFYLCWAVRRLGVDAGTLSKMCGWYLRVIVCDEDKDGRIRRPELRNYVMKYWPSLYQWALMISVPFPLRVWRRIRFLPSRLRSWWSGSAVRPNRS